MAAKKRYENFDETKMQQVENQVIDVFVASDLNFAEATAILKALNMELSSRAYFRKLDDEVASEAVIKHE